jgi:hypothetical protein
MVIFRNNSDDNDVYDYRKHILKEQIELDILTLVTYFGNYIAVIRLISVRKDTEIGIRMWTNSSMENIVLFEAVNTHFHA